MLYVQYILLDKEQQAFWASRHSVPQKGNRIAGFFIPETQYVKYLPLQCQKDERSLKS